MPAATPFPASSEALKWLRPSSPRLNNFSAYRVSSSLPKSTRALDEVTRVLMQSDWEQTFGHDVANCLIRECSSVVFAKSRRSCSERTVLLLRHG